MELLKRGFKTSEVDKMVTNMFHDMELFRFCRKKLLHVNIQSKRKKNRPNYDFD